MKILLNILLSVFTVFLIILGIYNLVPFSYFKYISFDYWSKEQKLGAFTELSSTDAISAFPTTYNANLKKTIEIGTTTIPTITTLSGLTTANSLSSASSLATIGTITSGTWNGSIIGGIYGGTASSSLSQYRVLLGNGSYPITVASSTGTSGQFLTSNGANAYPSWQTSATDLTINYAWTGNHSFSQPLNASSSLLVNSRLSVATSTPSTLFSLIANGGALISGTSTISNLIVASTTPFYASTTVFTASGTWIKPEKVNQVMVTVIGGGGGGGGSNAVGASRGGGGGGGGYRKGIVKVFGNVTVTVGTGGAGGVGNQNGTAGGNSSFAGNTTITANGGGGGNLGSGTNGNGGSGGTTTGGANDFAVSGQAGTNGAILVGLSAQDIGGKGGDSPFGYGGYGGDEGGGSDGGGYGGGGGGADDVAGSAANGGAGANGVVMVEIIQGD